MVWVDTPVANFTKGLNAEDGTNLCKLSDGSSSFMCTDGTGTLTGPDGSNVLSVTDGSATWVSLGGTTAAMLVTDYETSYDVIRAESGLG